MLTLVDGGFGKITDGSGLDDVTNSESLDGLVLGDSARAVGASHECYVASAGLVAAMITKGGKKRFGGTCEQTCSNDMRRREQAQGRAAIAAELICRIGNRRKGQVVGSWS